MLYIRSSDLIYLKTESLYLFTNLCPLPPSPRRWQPPFYCFFEFNYFFLRLHVIPNYFTTFYYHLCSLLSLCLFYLYGRNIDTIEWFATACTFPAVCTVVTAVVGVLSIYQTHHWLWVGGGRVKVGKATLNRVHTKITGEETMSNQKTLTRDVRLSGVNSRALEEGPLTPLPKVQSHSGIIVRLQPPRDPTLFYPLFLELCEIVRFCMLPTLIEHFWNFISLCLYTFFSWRGDSNVKSLGSYFLG